MSGPDYYRSCAGGSGTMERSVALLLRRAVAAVVRRRRRLFLLAAALAHAVAVGVVGDAVGITVTGRVGLGLAARLGGRFRALVVGVGGAFVVLVAVAVVVAGRFVAVGVVALLAFF